MASTNELPDGRVYEQVSPSEKSGGIGDVYPLADVSALNSPIESSAEGGSITYAGDSFYEPQTGFGAGQYISSRGAAGWATQNISSPSGMVLARNVYLAFSSDLSASLFTGPQSADHSNDLFKNKGSSGVSVRLLDAAPAYSSPPFRFNMRFAGASADFTHVIFEANAALVPGAHQGGREEYNLYEWVEGAEDALRLVNVPRLGEGGSNASFGTLYNSRHGSNVTSAISENGSRIFWSDEYEGTNRLYMRENGITTAPLDVTQPGGAGPGGGGQFLTASSDGSRVLFLDNASRGLTRDTQPGSGTNLYLYNTESEVATDLTPTSNASVLGFVGASSDASYVYFVAEGALAHDAHAGEPNLYLWHEGEPIKTIATLSESDPIPNGVLSAWNPTLAGRLARVSPNGRYVAFYTTKSLTGYDNMPAHAGLCEQIQGAGCAEVYEYDAQTDALSCVSCGPSRTQPAGDTLLPRVLQPHRPEVDGVYQQRYLLDDGRLFFNTPNALVAQDKNGTTDVYEFEPDGVGSCRTVTGCVYPISTGTSPYPSEFADASEGGEDAFFTTRQPLVPEDGDELMDVYDARAGGGFPPAPAPVPCSDEACHDAPEAQAALETPSSTTFSGTGNVAQFTSGQGTTPRSSTRAQKLTTALKACRKKPRRKRVACESRARKLYGAKRTRASKSPSAKTGR